MSRKAMKGEYTPDRFQREKLFNIRKKTIMKKSSELSILCGVEVGAIIYSGDPSNPVPEVWPDHESIQQIIEECQKDTPVIHPTLSREEFLQSKINEGKEILWKRQQENRVEEISQQMIQCMVGNTMPNFTNWNDMKMMVEKTLNDINMIEQAYGREVEFSIPSSSMSQVLQPSSNANPYVLNPPTSEQPLSIVQNENQTYQHLHNGIDMGTMEGYMGIDGYDVPYPSINSSYAYAPSFHNRFSP